ncbi:MAG TPA: DNA-binding response regulator [Lachnoclostridium sp.]|nr:DNA-binding response regulator [Lachnoclostridium sp.]
MAYSVLIADDQSMARQLFEMFVKSSEKYRLVHSLESASVAHIYCSRFPIDLVLMDVVMADGVSGLEAAKRIKKVSPKTKIIIVTSMPEVSYIKRAREIGVESFWYKEASREPVLTVMDRTMAGESVYPDSAPVLTLGNAKSVEFTPKELEVLREMTMGLTNSAIAEKLFIDVTTVKSHVTHMLQKTGFQNRTELAIQARVSGLVIGEPEEETEKKR